jgi:hypothetical protein
MPGRKFNASTALIMLRMGAPIRRVIWTADCYIQAMDDDGVDFQVYAVGTDRFKQDIAEFPNMVLEQMIEEGDQWEVWENHSNSEADETSATKKN